MESKLRGQFWDLIPSWWVWGEEFHGSGGGLWRCCVWWCLTVIFWQGRILRGNLMMIPQKLISKCQSDYVTEVWRQEPQVRSAHILLLKSDFCDVIRLTLRNQISRPHIILVRNNFCVDWHRVVHWYFLNLFFLVKRFKRSEAPKARALRFESWIFPEKTNWIFPEQIYTILYCMICFGRIWRGAIIPVIKLCKICSFFH